MKFFKRNKKWFSVLLIIGMFLQIMAPTGGLFASAEESNKHSNQEEILINELDRDTELELETDLDFDEKLSAEIKEETEDFDSQKQEQLNIEPSENLETEGLILDSLNETSSEGKKIEENIIDDMKLKYKDGTKFNDGDLIAVDEDLKFELDWKLPNGHEYAEGDYFEFKLPEQITVYSATDGLLGDYGSYTVDIDGNVKFTFNENIDKKSDIEGTFWFDTELKEDKITSITEKIELVVNGEIVKTVSVNVKPTGGQAISKEGQPLNGNFETKEIEWTVIVNTTRDSLKKAIINDPILAGQELILNSIKLTEVEVNLDGTFNEDLDEITGFGNNSTEKELDIELGDTNKAYKLTFKTKLLEKDFKEGTTSYENTAYLKSEGIEDAQAGGSVSVTRRKFLEKTSSTFDEKYRFIEWAVNANFTEQSLKKDDVITDEFTFTVDEVELKEVFAIKEANITIEQVDQFDDNGNPTETSNAKDLFDVTIAGNKVTYKLKEDTNKAFIIKYKTELNEGAYIHKDGTITNKVDLDGKTDTTSQGVYQQVGKKSNAGINYEDKTIDWTITVNADKQDLRNFILTDSFAGSGQKLVDGSITIDPAIDSNKITVDDTEGFEIKFGDIKETYTITYQTKFTYDFGELEVDEKPDFKNNVEIKYKAGKDGPDYKLEIEDEVEPNDATKNNGAKNGTVDQETKEITWKIDINYNLLELTSAQVRDTIPSNQILIEGSVKVYETSIAENGDITVGAEVTSGITLATSDNQVDVDFDQLIDRSYRVEFKTKDKDGIYNSDEDYENTAQFIPREDEMHNLTANVTLPNQGEFIGKTGTHNKEDWTIDWKIDVNKSLSTTSDFTVTDDLGDITSQVLLEDTIKVTKAGSSDSLTEGEDYTLTVDGNKFKIHLPGEITEAFEITYSSYIIAGQTIDVTNKAKIESNDVIIGTTEETEIVNVKISTGGGTAEGSTGGLIIEKFEADTGRKLEDVQFTLVKAVGNKEIVVREGITDAEGKVEWTGLKYDEYTLKEELPYGYLGDAEQTVLISSEDSEGIKTLPLENTREKGTATINKVDANTGETLEGAEFILKNQTTDQEYTFTTNEHGLISEYVPFGEYTVEEIIAPDGYRITKDIPNIIVGIDKETIITVDNVAFVDLEGVKSWIVGEDIEIPESITVKLLADGSETGKTQETSSTDNWEYSFKDLDKYNESNEEIKYEIQEEELDGYFLRTEGYDLINIQSTNVSGTKTWKDDDNATNKRPSTITVHLLADGERQEERIIKVNKEGDWTYTFDNVPKYNLDGNEVNYTVEEDVVTGYNTEIDDYDITNTRSDLIGIKGEKIWRDDNSLDRPESITVVLTREIKGELDSEFSEELIVKPDDQGSWLYEFKDLDEFDENGVEWIYKVDEKEVEGYKTSIVGNDLINIRVGTIDITGKKIWVGGPEIKPTIQIQLYRNSEALDDGLITLRNGKTSHTWSGLDRFDNDGKAYSYTIEEVEVPEDYDMTIPDDGLTITNTHYSEKPSLPPTGINNNDIFFGSILLLGIATLIVLRLSRKRRYN